MLLLASRDASLLSTLRRAPSGLSRHFAFTAAFFILVAYQRCRYVFAAAVIIIAVA